MGDIEAMRERLREAMAIEDRENDREHHLEMILLRRPEGLNTVDNALIGVTLNASCGLFALVHGKLAHLETGDPFKERINLYCFKVAYSLRKLIKHLVPNVDENHEEARRRTLGNSVRGWLTFRTRGRATRQGAPPPLPELALVQHNDRVANARMRFPVLQHFTGELLNMTATGRDARAVRIVNQAVQAFQASILNDADRPLRQIRAIWRSVGALTNITRDRAIAYYVGRLHCELLVQEVVDAEFEHLRAQRLVFDFGPLGNLQRDIVRMVRIFYYLTGEIGVTRLDGRAASAVYREALEAIMDFNDRLDPFGQDRLVTARLRRPTPEELVVLGEDIFQGR